MNYYPEHHHRRSMRLKGYDYSLGGLYYITICVKDRKCLFGKVSMISYPKLHNKMILDETGKIADECWQEIPRHFPNVNLHAYIIMPNHMHGIIELRRGTRHVVSLPTDTGPTVGTSHVMSLQNQFSKPIPGSISVIIQQFKSSVTRLINKTNNKKFGWQSRFYERIIRSEQCYDNITTYIENNPENWYDDDFYVK